MVRLLAPVCLFVTLGCSNGGPTVVDNIDVAEETLAAARYGNIDYRGQLRAAIRGDNAPVVQLLRFTPHTDAAAAIGHGVALIDLIEIIGDLRFAKVAAAQEPELKRKIQDVLVAGLSYHVEWQSKGVTLSSAFPKTSHALKVSRLEDSR